MSDHKEVTAFAPASIGNVIVGFDVLGLCLENPGDQVTVRKTSKLGVHITSITGCTAQLPLKAEENTAGKALLTLLKKRTLNHGFEVRIEKGIPLGSGMGGSSSSAVGAVVAANHLLEQPLNPQELLYCAVMGEAVASGAPHADNVAPALFGGLRLVRGGATPHSMALPIPLGICTVLVHPDMRLDTRESRSVLQRGHPLDMVVQQSSNLAHFIAACYSGDQQELTLSMRDVLVEPLRSPLIPGFSSVQQSALDSGAIGCSISGGGPSIMAWTPLAVAEDVKNAMINAFKDHGMPAQGYISRLDAPGARVIGVLDD